MQTNTESIVLQWQAPAKNDHERSDRWYLIAGVIAAVLIVYGLWDGAWLMSLSIALCAGLYYLVRDTKHKTHSIVITKMSVVFDGVVHPWAEMKNFWMLQGADYCELHIANKRRLVSDLMIQVGPQDPFAVRDVLLEFLEQDANKRERILDAIIRFCKL